MQKELGSFKIDQMRSAWRDGDEPSLRRRRKIASLAVLGLVDFGIISLYQMGVIRSLPDCITGALLNFTMLPLAINEVREEVRAA